VNKQGSYSFQGERVNLKKFNKVEGAVQYHVEVSHRFTDLEDLDAEMDTNSAEKLLE
jgi:hypothetical protein